MHEAAHWLPPPERKLTEGRASERRLENAQSGRLSHACAMFALVRGALASTQAPLRAGGRRE
jgi:hypothetical protein